MKILFFGNVCNYAYWFAKWSRAQGYDAYALIEINDKHFSPEKEDSHYNKNAPPFWLSFYDPGTDGDVSLYSFYDKKLRTKLNGYDLIHVFSYSTAIAVSHFNLPFIFHNVGSFSRTINYFKGQNLKSILSVKYNLIRFKFRRALNKSKAIIVSVEVDKYEVLTSKFNHKLIALPIPYDCDEVNQFEISLDLESNGNTNVLLPSRQNWFLKGQDLIFLSISKIERSVLQNCRFFIMEWGSDIEKSKKMLTDLGLNEYFTWLPMLPRTELWRLMSNTRTIVIVEFCRNWTIGGLGGVSRDALAVGIPIITYYPDPKEYKIHLNNAPVFHSNCDEFEIQSQILKCISLSNDDFSDIKFKSRKWIFAECDYRNVMIKYFDLYNSIIK